MGQPTDKPTGLRVEFYTDVAGKIRWTQYAENGQIRHASEQGFANESIARENYEEGTLEAVRIILENRAYKRMGDGHRKRLEHDVLRKAREVLQ